MYQEPCRICEKNALPPITLYSVNYIPTRINIYDTYKINYHLVFFEGTLLPQYITLGMYQHKYPLPRVSTIKIK